MPTKNRSLLVILESYIDMLLNLIAFVVGYIFVITIKGDTVLVLSSSVVIAVTICILFFNMLMAAATYHALGLYSPTRYVRTFRSFPAVLKSNLVFFGANTIIAAFATRSGYKEFILLWILFAAVVSTAFLTFKRHIIRLILKFMRDKQYNLKRVIIIGDNTGAAKDYLKEVNNGSQHGIMVLGYVGDKIDPEAIGIDKLGSFRELAAILDKYQPTDVVFAIDAYDKRHLIKLVNMCDDRCIKVYFLPVIYGFFKSSRQIEQLGSVPIINIHSTPLDNLANAFMKRLVDIVGSVLLILLASPVMIFAAIGVRISSPGPIFFRQERVGKMGKKFTMLKFRSMRVNDESDSKWTTGKDSRKTKFGTFIRKTSIDELPQLFNVLVGNMSLVGPRPEIPVFVEHFKEIIPLYMVKHYVKPGMTGLAQIKGLRGDTSVEDRIHEDIAYIENWSMLLDLYILIKTPLKAVNKSEQYVGAESEAAPESESTENAETPNTNSITSETDEFIIPETDTPRFTMIVTDEETEREISREGTDE